MKQPLLPVALLLALAAAAAARPAAATESYDNCSGFVDSLPAVITTQGVWCLRADLATAIASGNAIVINSNNVILDCNHFKLGGLAAGPASQAYGINSSLARNVVVRNCNVRGFYVGLYMAGLGGTNLVEDNRFEGNLSRSIWVTSDGAIIRRNQVLDTGGTDSFIYGIFTSGPIDVLDNTVTGMQPVEGGLAYGIYLAAGAGGRISGNMVRGIDDAGDTASTYGIYGIGGSFSLVDNQVHGPLDIGLRCGNATGVARDNIVFFTTLALQTCVDVDNILNP